MLKIQEEEFGVLFHVKKSINFFKLFIEVMFPVSVKQKVRKSTLEGIGKQSPSIPLNSVNESYFFIQIFKKLKEQKFFNL